MIPQEKATKALAKAEAEIVTWELRVAQQRERVRALPYVGAIDCKLAEQILATFQAALKEAHRRRNRLLARESITRPAPQQKRPA